MGFFVKHSHPCFKFIIISAEVFFVCYDLEAIFLAPITVLVLVSKIYFTSRISINRIVPRKKGSCFALNIAPKADTFICA